MTKKNNFIILYYQVQESYEYHTQYYNAIFITSSSRKIPIWRDTNSAFATTIVIVQQNRPTGFRRTL